MAAVAAGKTIRKGERLSSLLFSSSTINYHLHLHLPRRGTTTTRSPILPSQHQHRLSFRTFPGYTAPEEKIPMPDPAAMCLLNRVVPEAQRAEVRAKAEAMPAVRISPVDVEWAHVVADGWASPLGGFMTKFQYLQSLHFRSLRTGPDGMTIANMSIPIVLAISDDDRRAILSTMGELDARCDVALLGPTGDLFGVLGQAEIYRHNKKERVIRTWGIRALRSPYVKEVIHPAGDWLIGGILKVLEPIKYNDGADHYRLSPLQLRMEFYRREADAVLAFQPNGPLHNGHALYLNFMRTHLLEMGYKNPILLLHPLGGFNKPCDLPSAVLMEQYNKVLTDGVLDPATTVLAIFPSPMNYSGQAEIQWHAKARMNAGANFYVIDESPAGFGSRQMYLIEDGDIMFDVAPGLEKMYRLPYWLTAYDKVKKKMAFPESQRDDDFVDISEAKMRRYALNGRSPPPGFMCPSGWKVLADYYRSTHKERKSAPKNPKLS